VAAVAALVVLGSAAAIGGWLSTSGSSSPGGGSGSSGSSASVASEAARLAAGALAAARAAGSFHYVSSSSSDRVRQLTVGDAGPSSGRQVITLNGDTFNVLVIGSTAYFQGDATAMVENLSVPASVAQAHAGQWISLVSGDDPYESVYAAVTTSDALHDSITFSPRSVVATPAIAGQRATAVQGRVRLLPGESGTVKGTGTLYLSASGHLPLRYVERGTLRGSGGTVTPLDFRIDFSAWAEVVRVTVPAGAVTYASLGVPPGTGAGSPPTTLVA
jgi:hypothetical protein